MQVQRDIVSSTTTYDDFLPVFEIKSRASHMLDKHDTNSCILGAGTFQKY